MARKPLEESFFGDESPPKKGAGRKFKERKTVALPPKTDSVQASESSGSGASPPAIFQSRQVSRDWEFEEAVIALGDILHPEERVKYAYILDPYHNKPLLEEAVNKWRQDHGLV